jgi:hypothetical protein
VFNLNVELQSVSKNVLVDSSEIRKYLETSCKRFVDMVNSCYNLDLDYDSSFNVKCKVNKNSIKCSIKCDSYDTILKITQGFFRMETLEFNDYKFETMALQIDEVLESQVLEFVSA